jgi:hypothetical protein
LASRTVIMSNPRVVKIRSRSAAMFCTVAISRATPSASDPATTAATCGKSATRARCGPLAAMQ